MMITKVERSLEPCVEGGYYGYYVHFTEPVGEAFVLALSKLGNLMFLKDMPKPFFLLRGRRFVLRGQLGDAFCKLGIEGNDSAVLEEVQRQLRGL